MEPKGEVSPDGQWYWDGQKWITTLSPDGQSRWDGRGWIAARAPAVKQSSIAAFRQIPGLRTGAAWKLALAGFAVLVLSAAIGSAVSKPQATPTGHEIAQVQPSPTPSMDTQQASPSPTVAANPSPSPSPSQAPTPSPSPKVVIPPPSPPPAPVANTCGAPTNPWGYNFCGGSLIYSPPNDFCSYFNCIPSFWKSTNGYVDECTDGTYSHSGGRQGACSHHQGEMRPLYSP